MAVTPKNCLGNQWPTSILNFNADIIRHPRNGKRTFKPGKGNYRLPVKNCDLVINDIEPIAACAFF
jgi:hypothetical protein